MRWSCSLRRETSKSLSLLCNLSVRRSNAKALAAVLCLDQPGVPAAGGKAAPVALVTERAWLFGVRLSKLPGKRFYFCLVNVLRAPSPAPRWVFPSAAVHSRADEAACDHPRAEWITPGSCGLTALLQGKSVLSSPFPAPQERPGSSAGGTELAASFYAEGGDSRAVGFRAAAKPGCAGLFSEV